MGLQIGNIISKKEIELSDLKGKILAVDASNIIYQFLSTIRQPDGTPLQDSKGRITSHISGLFYRNIRLLNEGIKLIYVFDGKPPKLKELVKEKRKKVKDIAREKYESAKTSEDIGGMGKYAKQLAVLDKEKSDESKALLKAMGIAVIQAPSEAEAQASYMTRHTRDIYAIASQDYDCLMFDTPLLLQNLTLAKTRKTAGGVVEIKPQLIELKKVKAELKLNQDQLICIGILSGTDYNPKGVPGIGPKKALKLVQEFKVPEKIFASEAVKDSMDFSWRKVFKLIREPKVKKDYKIEYGEFDFARVKKIMVGHEFSEERIDNQFKKIYEAADKAKQKTLF